MNTDFESKEVVEVFEVELISSSAILHMPLQIASSGSPVVSLSASSVTSIGNYYKPDSLCATNRTDYLLLTLLNVRLDKK